MLEDATRTDAAAPVAPPADPGPPASRGGGASAAWDVLYAGLFVLGFPYLLWRRWVRGKDTEGQDEKFGKVPARPTVPARIWIHAVSVGEARAAETLCRALRQRVPGAEIVISTTTQTGQAVARQFHGAERVFYYPYDFSWAVRRCLDRVRPALIVLLELEVWPNLTAEALRRGIPVVVVNGRITERSAGRYRLAGALLRGSFRRVRRWLMQSAEYAERVQALGVEPARIEVAGNLKYDAVETRPPGVEERAAARRALGLDPEARVLIGGSTHPGEDEALLAAYAALRDRFPGLRLALAPRHPHRLEAVAAAITARGFAVLRRSGLKAQGAAAWEAVPPDARGAAVVLVDTVGELSGLYRAAEVAFVGGSLIPHGGQNVMEPAGLGLAVVHGPYMHNFAEAVAVLRDADGSVQVEDMAALPGVLDRLLAAPARAQAMGERARAALLKRQGAASRCAACLEAILEGGSQGGPRGV